MLLLLWWWWWLRIVFGVALVVIEGSVAVGGKRRRSIRMATREAGNRQRMRMGRLAIARGIGGSSNRRMIRFHRVDEEEAALGRTGVVEAEHSALGLRKLTWLKLKRERGEIGGYLF